MNKEKTLQSLRLKLEGQEVFINILNVHAVEKRQEPVAVVPHTKDDILGVVNFRGRVLPLYNLNNDFSLPVPFHYAYLVVLEKDQQLVGILAGHLPTICEIEENRIYPLNKVFKEGQG